MAIVGGSKLPGLKIRPVSKKGATPLTMSESESGSVTSIESMLSEGCPVSPSFYYDQRDLVYQTRLKQRGRRALTAYRAMKSKNMVGGGICLPQDAEQGIKRRIQRCQTFRQSRKVFSQEQTFISL